MRELTIDEIEQVNGGFGPAVYGAIVLAGRVAASPAGRAAAKSFAQGFSGGVGAWAMTELSSRIK
jgi:lactobin A/cerein 7B family class IIb bacteriocin